MSSQQCVSQSIIQDKHGLVWLQDSGLMDGWMKWRRGGTSGSASTHAITKTHQHSEQRLMEMRTIFSRASSGVDVFLYKTEALP